MTDASTTESKTSSREIFGWCMFDFANSSYTTVIVSVVFNRYFINTVAPERGDFFWGLSVSISMLLVLVTAPVVGALADFSGAKKRFLAITYLGCVLTTAPLYFAGEGTVAFAMVLFIVSNFFFSSGENLVAAFLPEISTPKNIGRISGFGWALGYFGGLGSLLVCLPLTPDPPFLLPWGGLGSPFVRLPVVPPADLLTWCFPAVAAFFLVAGLPTFLWVRERGVRQKLPPGETLLTVGFSRVARTLRQVRRFRQLFRFLCVFLLYNAGVMIVVTFAAPFAEKEIEMDARAIFIFFLIVQVSAAIGAFIFGLIQDHLGARRTIVLTLVIWCSACALAYVAESQALFYVIGNLAGIAMGATQSGSRALVGLFSPVDRTAEFFGFWGLFWKLSGGLGPLLFGAVAEASGYRIAILCTGGLFALGLAGMFLVDEKEGIAAASASSTAPSADQLAGSE